MFRSPKWLVTVMDQNKNLSKRGRSSQRRIQTSSLQHTAKSQNQSLRAEKDTSWEQKSKSMQPTHQAHLKKTRDMGFFMIVQFNESHLLLSPPQGGEQSSSKQEGHRLFSRQT